MVDKHKLVEVLSKALPNWSFDEHSFIGPGIRRRIPIEALIEIASALEAGEQGAQEEGDSYIRGLLVAAEVVHKSKNVRLAEVAIRNMAAFPHAGEQR